MSVYVLDIGTVFIPVLAFQKITALIIAMQQIFLQRSIRKISVVFSQKYTSVIRIFDGVTVISGSRAKKPPRWRG
jgi:hypothetical protein